jgi:hypothetical protein
MTRDVGSSSRQRIGLRATPTRLLVGVVAALIVGAVVLGMVGPAPGSPVASPESAGSSSISVGASAVASDTTSSFSSVVSASSGVPAGAAAPPPASSLLPSAGQSPDVALAAATVPHFRHIYVVVMENRESGSIVGNAGAPYINSLVARYGLATNYRAVAHPSEPNYLALFSGSTQGVTDDGVHDFAGRNLASQLEAAGKTWRVFAQNVPPGCFRGAVAHDGRDGTGTYARKHEPAISFKSVYSRPASCRKIRDFTAFSPSAADFELIVPNLCNDMHDCSTAKGDAFLRGFIPRILRSPAMKGSVLFLTWDEGTSKLGGGGKVATVVIGPTVRRGFRSATPHSHYSLVRTIEAAWGLGCLNRSCRANTFREFFR